MNRRPWVKLWADCLNSRQLAKAGEAAEVLFYRLLALNGAEGDGDLLRMSNEDIAWHVRMAVADVEARLAVLDEHDLVELGPDGVRFLGWAERQAEISDAERARLWRQKKREQSERTPNVRRTFANERDERSCRILESEEESEEEQEPPHTQSMPTAGRIAQAVPSLVGVGVPSAAKGKIKRTTDADLQPWFEAAIAGLGQPLSWAYEYVLPTERIVAQAIRHALSPADVRAIAAHYRAKCKDGTPNYGRFADSFDRWRAAWLASRGGASPAIKTGQQLRAEGRCSEHPGERLDAAGRCELCDEVVELRERLRTERTEAVG